MDGQDGSATNVSKPHAAGRRGAKTVAAARVLPIDYRPIVEDAVAGLGDNTPDKRSEVYARARGVVKRHLELMRLPQPIVELEKLALEITLRKIERGWRSVEADKNAVRHVPPGQVERNAGTQVLGSPAKVPAARRRTLRSLPVVPRSRPAIKAPSSAAGFLRPLATPIGVAVALPIIAAAIFFGLNVDDKGIYRILVDGPVGRWLPGLDDEPSRAAHIAPSAGDVMADRRPTRVSPVRAVFAVPPDAPAAATRSVACGGSSISERNACINDARAGSTEANTPKSDSGPPWLESFATFDGGTSGRAPSTTPTVPLPSGGDVAIRGTIPYGTPEPHEATPPMSPDAAPGATPSQVARTPPVKPINAKVTALIESGKRAILKGDLDRAVRDFGEAIRIDPKYPDSYSERGQVLFKLGEPERAIADYSAVLARDPQRGAALRARGMAYLYTGKTDVALADLSKAIELAEHDPGVMAPIELFYARRSRGSIYDSKQDYDLEIADCTALIESYMHDPMLVEALTANYGNAGAANIVAIIYRQRASAFTRKSNWERAVADLTEAIPLSADRGYVALIDRSKLHEGLGRYKLAAADAQAALSIRPGSEEARQVLSRLSTPSRPSLPKGL
jgi:regulator of sirC expression with transglutaminase-like and TPR domain